MENKAQDKMIVALDLTEAEKIKKIIKDLADLVKTYKVGLVAYTKFGPDIIGWARSQGAEVFIDFKLYDIPNTMFMTARNFIELGVWAFTVHIKAGEKALSFLKRSLVEEALSLKKPAPLIIGVTELTSDEAAGDDVIRLAEKAKISGLDGVVCSAWEARRVKEKTGLITITPGIRTSSAKDDQKRTASVFEALREGSDYFVVGRPIVQADDYRKAAEDILAFEA